MKKMHPYRAGFAVMAFMLCLFTYAQTPSSTNTLYVNSNVTGGNGSGDSWENAIPQLSDALKYARLQYDADNTVYDAQPLKIFVAKGTYKPLYNARDNYYTETGSATVGYTDKDNAFVMVKNVQVYGGFDPENGIDDLTDTRIFGANGSVLSAEVGYDHISGDEAYHVVISSGAVGSALLNGFTLRDAYSNYLASGYIQVFGYYPIFRGSGGAISCIFSSPTIENCIITKNLTSQAGGIFNYQTASPTIINCTFIDNGTTGNGGAIYNSTNSSPTIINCNFTDNGGENGGAIYNVTNSNPIITNCSFTDNSSRSNGGGAIYNIASSPIITNSLFANNSARNSISLGIWEEKNGGAIYNETTSSPVLTNVTIADNLGANTVYSTGAGSSTFNNSIVFGTVSATYTAQNSLIEGNAGGTNGNLDGTSIVAADVFINASGGNYGLKYNSLVINAGSNALFSGLNVNTLDLAGNARVYDFANGGIIDLGAYEHIVLPDNIIYVNINVVGGTGDGSSWANAIPELADALKYARQQYDADNTVYDAQPLKIYVAKGTYKPLYSARNGYYTQTGSATPPYTDQDNAFVMVKNVQIYGGFDPENNITDLTHTRIIPTNGGIVPDLANGVSFDGSVLSADIGAQLSNFDNTYHVVISSNDVGNAVLEGFYITDAYSSSSTSGQMTVFGYPVQNSLGAMYCVRSSPTVENCIFYDNNPYAGGAIYNYQQSSPTITNCSFIDNSAQYVGGIYNLTGSSPTITNCTFTKNDGAIYNATNSNPIITNCSFKNNYGSTQGGGAIYNSASSPIITNSLFANNGGGAIYNESTSSPVLTNVTIADNVGANTVYSTGSGSATFYNSIVFGTISATYTAEYSLIEGNTDFTNGNIDMTGITTNDVFTDNANGDYTLKSTSPAIDMGSNALNSTTEDLAGNARIFNNAIIDLGAYESEYTPIVLTPDANGIIYVKETATGNTDGSSWNNATTDLHNAIHTDGVQKVFVAVGNYNVGANSFVMKNNVEIYGGFDPANGIDDLSDTRILPNSNNNIEGTVLNGQNIRPLIWNFNNGINSSAVLDGFTLKNGSSVNGGAIHNRSVSPTLRNLWIKNNTASADGGGIFNENSVSSVISNVTIENNTANFAGGIFNKNSSSPEMNNVVIRNNTANNDGGGMYNDVSSSPVMTNVSITENTAQNGAGMYNRNNSSPVLVNTLIADNTAVTNGGAIRNEATSSPQLVNVTIVNNTGSTAIYATDGNTVIDNSIVFGTVSATYTAQYSLIEGNADGTNNNLDGTTITANDVFNDNAGGDYTLKSASPVINAGSNALFAGLNENTKDLAGNARVYGFNNSGIIDLGAYESEYTPAVPITPDANNILYVNINVTGGNGSGNSWANAIPQLADALKYARQQYNADNTVYDTTPLKIFVAKGTYKPMYSGADNNYTNDADRNNAFVMVKNVQIYGGFDPGNNIDDLTDTRIFGDNGSILSADIGTNSNLDNAYHVVISSNNVGNAVLDGFYITDGYVNFSTTAANLITVNGYPVYTDQGTVSCVRSSPTIVNCYFNQNQRVSGGYGGAIYNGNQSSPTITNCTFYYNSATFGGTIYNYSTSSPVITNCSFILSGTDNESSTIFNVNNSNPIITNCSFTRGGTALYNDASSPSVINTLFAGNNRTTDGIIKNISTSSPVLTNVTFANNTATNAVYSTGTGSTTFHNSIVFGTVSATYTAQYSLIEGNSDFTNGNMDMTGIATDDVFTDNTNGDYTLKSTSPVIDMGNNALNSTTFDLAGNARIYNSANGGIIDLGAYESEYAIFTLTPDANGIIYVKETATGSTNGSSWNNATSDLHNAIFANGVQKVFVAKGNYNVGSTSFIMKNNVEIYGGFDPDNGIEDLNDNRILPTETIGGSVLDGENTRTVILNDFTVGNPLNNTAVLDGFTLTQGRNVPGNGGGIYNYYASPVLTNLVIKNSVASNGGGAMYNRYSSPVVTNISLLNNTAYAGGGVFNYESSVALSNITISGNTASGDGGAIYNDLSSLVFTNIKITGNTGADSSVVLNTESDVTFINAEITGNHTVNPNSSADIYNSYGGNMLFLNSTFAYNNSAKTFRNTWADGEIQVKNSIIFDAIDDWDEFTAEYSFIQDNEDDSNGNIVLDIDEDDVFTDADNGDFTLKINAPVINSGNNTLFTGLDENTLDLAGNPRLFGANIDLGAYELQLTPSDCAASTTWNGTVWSNGLPDENIYAIIEGNLTVNTNMTSCELLLNSGVLTVNSGVSLTVVGKITNTQSSENFIIESGANLVQINDVVNQGSITVNRNSYPLYRQDYTLWGSPVTGQNLRNFSPQTLYNRFYSYNTNAGTIGEYTQEILTNEDVQNKLFESGKGYLIRMPNNWPVYVNNTIAGTAYSGQFQGIPNNGNINIPLSINNTAANLVANPYPSSISISAFFAANPEIEQTLYFWRKRNGVNGSGYASYNALGLTSSQLDINGLDLQNSLNVGQGFFIKSTGATTLTFNNSMREGISNGIFLKNSAEIEKNRIWLNLSNASDVIGQTLLGYATGATIGVDNGMDAAYFNDSSTALTSLINDAEFAIQARPVPFDVNDEVSLGFKTDTAGSYSISLYSFDGLFAANQNIYLKDNLIGEIHNLNLSDYQFVTDQGIFNNRFKIIYQPNLSINPPIKDANVLVYQQEGVIYFNSGNVLMQKIELLDVCGRNIYTMKNINNTTAIINEINISNQPLIVKIITNDSIEIIKKIIH